MEMEVSYDQKRTHIDQWLHRTTLTLWLNFLIFGEAHRGAQHINDSALKSQMAIFKILFNFGRSTLCRDWHNRVRVNATGAEGTKARRGSRRLSFVEFAE